jgi:type II secretory pathway predicted ATPase ExeA
MIDAVVTKFGFTRMPFGRDLPPSRLHRHADCGEAAARITWAVADKTICMVTGEVGTGKTVAIRCAVADLDPAALVRVPDRRTARAVVLLSAGPFAVPGGAAAVLGPGPGQPDRVPGPSPADYRRRPRRIC